ncbi:hypothetical protein LTR70_010360 [Exophiala xenobiotica]|uniref:Uncharacterized protein n=1 Tax=Lithohypha guttulata TaxID=1690604 RepID=A0ABR0JUJ4_9EURO|nr:hypothetical protein LTR24_010319 [Lithohypha guttulata]KAK5309360.1 hypothetical protein LTR70_010360 [Exophiala xenobiotica]
MPKRKAEFDRRVTRSQTKKARLNSTNDSNGPVSGRPAPDQQVSDQPGSDQRATESRAVDNVNTTISNTTPPAQASSEVTSNSTSVTGNDNSNQPARTELMGMPDELLVSIVNQVVLPRFNTHDPVDFPEPSDDWRQAMDTNHKIRALALETTTKEILFIDMRFCFCLCQPLNWTRAEYSRRMRRLLVYLSSTLREKPPVAHERTAQNHVGKPVSTLRINLSRHMPGEGCPGGVQNFVRRYCFRANRLYNLFISHLIQRETQFFRCLNFQCDIWSDSALNLCEEFLDDLAATIRCAHRVGFSLTGMATVASRHTAQSLSNSMTVSWLVSSLGNALQYTLTVYTGLLNQGFSTFYLAANAIDTWDVYKQAIEKVLRPVTYRPQQDTHRRLFALNGNLMVLAMDCLAHYLLVRSNYRGPQRHWSLTDVRSSDVMIGGPIPGFWQMVLDCLDDAETSVTDNDLASNIDFWCSVNQAMADLQLAFARAAFVVGDDDDVLDEKKGPRRTSQQDDDHDPIDDIRHTSSVPWETRYDKAEEHLVQARGCYEFVLDKVQQSNVQNTANMQQWLKQWQTWEKAISKGVKTLRKLEQRRQGTLRRRRAARAGHMTGGMASTFLPVVAPARVTKLRKRRKDHQASSNIYPCTGLRAPMFKAVRDCKLLIDITHQNYTGAVRFRHYM